MKEVYNNILNECRSYTKKGKVASYIPELAKANPEYLSLYIISKESEISVGDYNIPFTAQSIIKPIIF